MRALARDSVAFEHLVHAQLIPVGAEEYEVSCSEHEQIVLCPAWTISGTLGPGRHRWRCPDPQFPATAYFVRTTPVRIAFAMSTAFELPSTGQTVTVRANGALQARCSDVDLLIAQVVGLPSDSLNEEILRSVCRSVERRLARLLTRRAVTGGVATIIDPAELPTILADLAGCDLSAGAVRGIEVVTIDELAVAAEDRSSQPPTNTVSFDTKTERFPIGTVTSDQAGSAYGEITVHTPPPTEPITSPGIGVVGVARHSILDIGMTHIGAGSREPSLASTPVDGAIPPRECAIDEANHDSGGLSPGTRVLVPSPTGLMQSATVRRMQSGHYELEVGGTGETMWVPVSGVVPE